MPKLPASEACPCLARTHTSLLPGSLCLPCTPVSTLAQRKARLSPRTPHTQCEHVHSPRPRCVSPSHRFSSPCTSSYPSLPPHPPPSPYTDARQHAEVLPPRTHACAQTGARGTHAHQWRLGEVALQGKVSGGFRVPSALF